MLIRYFLIFIFTLASLSASAQSMLNSHYGTVGYIKSDGRVQDSHYSTIGYAKDIPMRWAALYFSFFKR